MLFFFTVAQAQLCNCRGVAFDERVSVIFTTLRRWSTVAVNVSTHALIFTLGTSNHEMRVSKTPSYKKCCVWSEVIFADISLLNSVLLRFHTSSSLGAINNEVKYHRRPNCRVDGSYCAWSQNGYVDIMSRIYSFWSSIMVISCFSIYVYSHLIALDCMFYTATCTFFIAMKSRYNTL